MFKLSSYSGFMAAAQWQVISAYQIMFDHILHCLCNIYGGIMQDCKIKLENFQIFTFLNN